VAESVFMSRNSATAAITRPCASNTSASRARGLARCCSARFVTSIQASRPSRAHSEKLEPDSFAVSSHLFYVMQKCNT